PAPAPVACANNLDCASATACKTVCANDNDCASPSTEFCDLNASSGTYRQCLAKKPGGGACTADNQCTYGQCIGNTCCGSTACVRTGACQANGCSATGGTCQYPGSSTNCVAQTCVGGQLTAAVSCDGAGGCPSSST